MEISSNGYIYCGGCSLRGPYVGADILKAFNLARAAGFEYRMVHSGPDPEYRWECSECREFHARLVRPTTQEIAAAAAASTLDPLAAPGAAGWWWRIRAEPDAEGRPVLFPVEVVEHAGQLCTRVPTSHYLTQHVPVQDDRRWCGPAVPPPVVPEDWGVLIVHHPTNQTGP